MPLPWAATSATHCPTSRSSSGISNASPPSRRETGTSKSWAAWGSSASVGGSSGSAREPENSASRRASSGPNREARLFRGRRSTSPIDSTPTSSSAASVRSSSRNAAAGKWASGCIVAVGTTAHRRGRRRQASRPVATGFTGFPSESVLQPATRCVKWAAAQAAPGASAIATRAWMPRAVSVQAAVRANDSSPPKKPAVLVISTIRHSGWPPGRDGFSRATSGANRRHQRASFSNASRSANGSSCSTRAA